MRRAVVRIKGVKSVTAKGKTYHYHRRTMTRLPGAPGSAEFLLALQRLDEKKPAATLPGTLGSLISAYRASPEFQNLAPNSRRSYDLALDIMATSGDYPLVAITPASLYELRDQLAAVRGRTVVNRVLMVLRLLFAWGKDRRLVRGENPVDGVRHLRRPHDAKRVNRPWSDAELETVLDAAKPKLRLAIVIAAYTGLRESDVVSVPWSAYDGRAFETRTQKTGQRVRIPAHSRLRQTLAPRGQGDVPIVGGSASSLRVEFYRLTAELRAEGKVAEGLSFHGLRHMLGHKLAEAGADPPTIAAVLGQSTSRMAEWYSRTASRDHLAAVAFAKLDEAENRRGGKGKPPDNSLISP